jgi:hypothetical protein
MDSRHECQRQRWERGRLASARPTRGTVHALLILFLLIILAACSTGGQQASGGPVAKVSPTPTVPSVPPGTVLFKADWSHGLSAWGNTKGWQIVNGMPLSDLSADNALTVPYLPGVHNYAIECRFQVVRVPRSGGYFIIKAPRTGNEDGYTAGILGLFAPGARTNPFSNPEATIYLDPLDHMQSQMAPIDYDPFNNWHTFRVQIKGPVGDLFIDGADSSTAVSEGGEWLSNGPLQIVSSLAIVRISSVTVTAL